MTATMLLERFKMIAKAFLPDGRLNAFPPDFTIRRPILSLLRRRLGRGEACFLALYRWESKSDPEHRQHSREEEKRLSAASRKQLTMLAREQFGSRELIGMDQYGPQDYVVLVSAPQDPDESFVPVALFRRLELLRHAFEGGTAAVMPEAAEQWQLTGTYVPVSSASWDCDPNAAAVLKETFDFALALATGAVTPQVIEARRQLDEILAEGRISVLAQPIMDLRSGDVYGWEILTRGPAASVFHMPDELFRFAGQSKLLSKLEFIVVRHALDEIASRRICEPVFLNVTPVTLAHPLFMAHLEQCLERHPSLSPGQIVLEITERHEIHDLAEMSRILDRFREKGYRFAIDDAGSGYSSLQWIGELMPELIKIDRSVIQFVDRYKVKESLLRAIVTAAEEMNCDVVAEGVEREEEADVLFRLNVSMGQGYYFARPNPLMHEHERGIFQEMKERIQIRRGLVAS
ncbi:EAL domain-containing protein [Cohnella sp. OV330]|uniref:EAL domain-containing protein n=1 Tax=Cohnella sp. OV330 TaxID=1855288 RepID=UPI000B7D35C3|nr:EAL domain-containing protein [Cohnella sp. OV330]